MKINVNHIIVKHIKTLCVNSINKISFIDIFIFYLIPAFIVMAIVHLFEIKMHKDIYNVSISAFAIFASLLLNVQIALFGIF